MIFLRTMYMCKELCMKCVKIYYDRISIINLYIFSIHELEKSHDEIMLRST